jgi:2-polyprenyl-6-hydroxyphenyl methylase/3-demethylubiquinone-9 3-methyltransferase
VIDAQIRLSERFDQLLPERLRVDGYQDFAGNVVPRYAKPNLLVYDVGGGKHPNISRERKRELALRIIGLDADSGEMRAAPAGYYDGTICADITQYRRAGDADLVVCDALLEHVYDTNAALQGIASILKTGGAALLFVPSRRAVYAWMNRLLPQSWKRWLLFRIYPERRPLQGFPAYYDRCTPGEITILARRCGLQVESLRSYFHSDYFTFFFPLHVVWRVWQLCFRGVCGEEAAETMAVVLRKVG